MKQNTKQMAEPGNIVEDIERYEPLTTSSHGANKAMDGCAKYACKEFEAKADLCAGVSDPPISACSSRPPANALPQNFPGGPGEGSCGQILEDDKSTPNMGPHRKVFLSHEAVEVHNRVTDLKDKSAPPQRQNLWESLKYATKAVLWVILHSTILGIIPTALLSVIFGSTWLFNINNDNILKHMLISNSIFLLASYLTIFSICLYVFGKEKVMRLLYRVSLPLYLLNISIHALRQIYVLSYLSFAYYVVFIYHYFILLWTIKKSPSSIQSFEPKTNNTRFDVLASDGTPMAFFRGFVPYVMAYYISAYHLIPFFMKSGILVRIFGRIIILPFIFNLVDTYQNSILIHKSKGYLRYRVVPGNLMNCISLLILRLMVTDSPDLYETALMSFSASVFEIIFRTTYILRTIYVTNKYQYIKSKVHWPCTSSNKIQKKDISLHNAPPVGGPCEHNCRKHAHLGQKYQEGGNYSPDLSECLAIGQDQLGWTLIERFKKSQYFEFVFMYHSNRAYYTSAMEIQSTFFIPLVLFLCKPMKRYVTFQTFSNPRDMAYSILIQFIFEVISNVVSTSVESYFYGMKIPVVKSRAWEVNLKSITQATLLILMLVFMSTAPFRKDSELWQDD